jgi:hypothetical protein
MLRCLPRTFGRVMGALGVATVLGFAGVASAAGNWTLEAPLSAPRYGLAAAAGPNGTIFAIGGLDTCCYSTVVDVYRPSLGKWVRRPDLALGLCMRRQLAAMDGFT